MVLSYRGGFRLRGVFCAPPDAPNPPREPESSRERQLSRIYAFRLGEAWSVGMRVRRSALMKARRSDRHPGGECDLAVGGGERVQIDACALRPLGLGTTQSCESPRSAGLPSEAGTGRLEGRAVRSHAQDGHRARAEPHGLARRGRGRLRSARHGPSSSALLVALGDETGNADALVKEVRTVGCRTFQADASIR